MTRLRYLADVRLPTEKAHGWQIVQMCGAFAAEGVEVELATPRRRQPDPSLQGRSVFDYYGVPETFSHRFLTDIDLVRLEQLLPHPLEAPVNQAHSYAWARHAVTGERRRRRPDLLYTRDLGIAVRAITAGIPVGWEVHGAPGSLGARMLARALAGARPRVVVALTPFLRDALISAGVREADIIVEGDALDPAPYANLPSAEAARSALGLPPGPLVGFVGRFRALEAERGLIDLIRALAAVRTEPEPTLVLVGGPMDVAGRYRAEALAAGLPPARLIIVDRVPNQDVPTWLRALDIGVMPYPASRHYAEELSPLKMFEYMGAGLPMVASDLPSIRLHLRDGENALLVAPGDPASFAAAITRLIQDPALGAALASRAREDVAAFTWRGRAERILEAAGVRP